VRLLLDQNLSRHLVARFRDAFPESMHVLDVDLDSASDREVWEYARDHDLALVSKDSDFRQLAFLHGPPPKVVWLRVGNASTSDIATVILDHIEAVEAFVANDDEALLVLPTASADG
jgi:predicted nuclease of predicted toxin-antitoxin system